MNTSVRSMQVPLTGLGALVATLATLAETGWGQVATPPPPAVPPAPGGWGNGVIIVLLGLGFFVTIGIVVKLVDLSRKRSEEAMYLQALIGDAWLQDSALAMLPLAATVHVPFWRGSPAMIQVTGRVPAPTLRDTAIDVAARVTHRTGAEFKIEDHVTVTNEAEARVA